MPLSSLLDHLYTRAAAAQNEKSNITPKEHTFDIKVIDKKIDKELKSLHGVLKTFLKNPEPPTWVPPNYVTPSNREFLTSLRIPCYDNGNPSLLFHDLDVCDDNEIEKIFGRGTSLYVVIHCALNPSYHGLQLHLQHIRIGQNSAHVGRPHKILGILPGCSSGCQRRWHPRFARRIGGSRCV
jgi:hypothetical protein